MERVLENIRARSDLNAFITVCDEYALSRAELVKKETGAGRMGGPLAGVSFAVKDNICTAGIRTTCASRMLRDFVPPYSAEAVRRLEAAGAIMVGKTNMDEFAMGSASETGCFGAVHNPHDVRRSAGGSSGGSAAAVAAGLVPFALGSDTGGSVRQPAAYCGIYGLKPTYGAVSRYGLIAYASGFDQIGILAASPQMIGDVWLAIAGRDEKDSTSKELPEGALSGSELTGDKPLAGLRVGVLKDVKGLGPEISQALVSCADRLAVLGAELDTYELPGPEALGAYYIIACAQASSNLARYDGVKYGLRVRRDDLDEMYNMTRSEGFGEEVRRRILLGTFVLGRDCYESVYLKAVRTQQRIKRQYEELFGRFDMLLGPVTDKCAPMLGEASKRPLEAYESDIYTVTANLTGLPALCVPWSKDAQGLPVGVMLTAPRFGEERLIAVAEALKG